MKGFLLGLLFSTSPALAQWVEFTPCGLKVPKALGAANAFAGPSPNIGPAWVWAPSVIGVMGFRPHEEDVAICSTVYLQGGRFLVIGSPLEVLRKLRKK